MSEQTLMRYPRATDILTLGFGTSLAMWAVAYVCRFPAVTAPGAALLVLLLAALLAGGFLAGRLTGRGWRGGAATGVLASAINLLVLGSLLGGDEPNRIVPSAIWWVPGSLAVGAMFAGSGAWVGGRVIREETASVNWLGAFARVAASATFLLVIVGGLVTSYDAGLAVVDWPNSFGYNMFLYPLSRMTGGVYYEHSHRLFGSLVGLTTIVLAALVASSKAPKPARPLAAAAVIGVIVQGILGGLRVTGRFTLSDSPEMTVPNTALAVVHGVTGQLFFGLMVILAVLLSVSWQTASMELERRAPGKGLRPLASGLVAMLVLQIMLGAVLRHLATWLMLHIVLATLVFFAAIACGTVVIGMFPSQRTLRFAALLLIGGVVLQMLLGIGALIVTTRPAALAGPAIVEAAATTAHQAMGAALLACTIVVALWVWRITSPAGAVVGGVRASPVPADGM